MLPVQRLGEAATLPKRMTHGAGGYDLYAAVYTSVPPGARVKVPTGLAVQIPEGHVGLLKTRSSMAAAGVDVVGGVLDADYTGEVFVLLHNTTTVPYAINVGQRIAQLVMPRIFSGDAGWVGSLAATARGSGGFGSTG